MNSFFAENTLLVILCIVAGLMFLAAVGMCVCKAKKVRNNSYMNKSYSMIGYNSNHDSIS